MPYVLVWNRAAIEEKMVRLAAYLALAKKSFEGVLEWVLELRRTIGIPHTLAELGVKPEHAAAFAPQAFADLCTGGNPVPIDTPQFEKLYMNCIRGSL
jgi:alcohol dehydrogenase class IV